MVNFGLVTFQTSNSFLETNLPLMKTKSRNAYLVVIRTIPSFQRVPHLAKKYVNTTTFQTNCGKTKTTGKNVLTFLELNYWCRGETKTNRLERKFLVIYEG